MSAIKPRLCQLSRLTGQRTYEATGPVLSCGYLCELQELSPLSTEVAVDSWEAGNWVSPPGSKGSSLAGDMLRAEMLPPGCCL